MRRVQRILRTAAAASILIGVISISGFSAASAHTNQSVTTLQMWARADDVGFLPQLVKSFNATHSTLKIDLTLVPDAEVVQKYSLAASTGSGPDLVSTEIGTMATFTPTNWYQNITSLVNSLPYRKALSPAHLGKLRMTARSKGFPLPRTSQSSTGTRRSSVRLVSTRTSLRPIGHRSRLMLRRSAPWGVTPTATSSLVRAPDAWPSQCCPTFGRKVATF